MKLDFQHHVSLKGLNSFGIDARAASFVRIDCIEQLQALTASAAWASGPHLILGGGSNLLLTRDFDGLVVQVALKGRDLIEERDAIHQDAWIVRAAAGENWDDFVRWTLHNGWAGLENLALIPGNVGAAPIQNIGAYGIELKDRFHALEVFDMQTKSLQSMNADECRFAYRDSIFKHELRDKAIITSVSFRLPKVWQPMLDYGDIRHELSQRNLAQPAAIDVADCVSTIRRSKLPDPAAVGNAGSFFKNPWVDTERHTALKTVFPTLISYAQAGGGYKLAAGWLIDQCGWKGRSLPGSNGRAAVHDRQALVLVNRGGAGGTDILSLAHAVQESVMQKFGVMLEAEPVIV